MSDDPFDEEDALNEFVRDNVVPIFTPAMLEAAMEPSGPKKRLIVLASGWTDVDAVWWPMARAFGALGWDTFRTSMPGRGFGAIEDSALHIMSALETVRDQYDDIVWVGHSMGGLIGRFLVHVFEADYFSAYVSLGTPHGGSHVAALASWWSASAAQMTVGSDFMKGLNSYEWPEHIPALALQASFDEAVRPRKHSKMKGATNLIIPGTSHVTLPVSKYTIRSITGWLMTEVFKDPYIVLDNLGYSSKLILPKEF